MPTLIFSLLGVLVGLAQGPQPLWVYQEQSGIVCSPLVADLNGDGRLETLILGQGGEVTCLGPDGVLLWRANAEEEFNSGAAVADLNGDGAFEIVAATRGGKVLCLGTVGLAGKPLSPTGRLLWQYQLANTVDWTSVGVIGTGDATCLAVSQTEGTVTYLSTAGELVREVRVPSGATSLLAVADVNGDGRAEMLVPCEYGQLVCLTAEGDTLWTARPVKNGVAGPVCADLNGDGAVEVLVGGGEGTLFALEGASGRTLWSFPSAGAIDASIAVADLDGDGRKEIVFTSMWALKAYCLDAQGKKRWEFATHGKVPYAPAIGDVDADGAQEIVLPDRSRYVYFLAPDGTLKEEMRVEGGMNASPALGDVDGDGALEMVLATETGKVYCFRMGKYQDAASLLWPMHRLDLTQSADATGGRAAVEARARVSAADDGAPQVAAANAPGSAQASVSAGDFFLGGNTALGQVSNPDGEAVRLLLAVTDPTAVRYSTAVDFADKSKEVALRFPVLASGDYRAQVTLRRLSDGAVLDEAWALYRSVALGAEDEALVNERLGRVGNAIERLRARRPQEVEDLELRLERLQRRLTALRERARVFAEMSAEQQAEAIAFAAGVREEAEEWAAVAECSAARLVNDESRRVVVWRSNPWEAVPALARPATGLAQEIAATVLKGEWYSTTVNLTNLTSVTRSVRVRPHPAPAGAPALPWERLTIREVTNIAAPQAEGAPVVYADYLPEANAAGYFLLPAWETRQVWLTLDTRGLEAGEYLLPLVVSEVAPERSAEIINVRLRVRPVALPEPNPFLSCWWSYREWDTHPEWAKFQADYYINLFPGVGIPLGEFDEGGKMVKPPDFSQVDAYVALRRSAGQASFLFNEPFISLPDGFEVEEVNMAQGRLVEMRPRARRMYEQWLPLVAAHLKDLGLDYADWAFYPIDEPNRGATCLIASLSRVAKQIDPRARFYIDFVSPHDVYDLQLVLPYYDLWCPQPENAFHSKWGQEFMRQALAAGGQVVCYGIYGPQSTWRRYRIMPWECAKYGATGAGGWVLIDHPWGAWPSEPGATVANHAISGGWEHLYPTKRLEAYREGVEDYLYLYLLGQLADRAEAAGLRKEAAQARSLREEAMAAVLPFGEMPGLPVTAGQQAQASSRAYETLEKYRALVGGAIEALGGVVPSGQ